MTVKFPHILGNHIPSLGVSPSVCTVFLCEHTTRCEAYSFTADGYGIFNLRTHSGACCTHEGGSGTNKSAQELTRRDRKTVSHPAPGARGSNPGSSDYKSDTLSNHWATSPVINNNSCELEDRLKLPECQCPFVLRAFTPYFKKVAHGSFFFFFFRMGSLTGCMHFFVWSSSYHRLWGVLFYDSWIYNILNMCTHFGACCTHEGG